MSIDFANLTNLETDRGVVTKIEDAEGNVLWTMGGKVVLEVAKVTSDTYAGETTYTGEQFILLDIYPKTNGTVAVTYGDITKTITDTSGAEEPNAQQVFFGTFNGVTDPITTPASGELIIEGDYYAFGQGVWKTGNKDYSIIPHQSCITEIKSWGNVTKIPTAAFGNCVSLTSISIPARVTSIDASAFAYCTELTSVTLPEGITEIPVMCFNNCSKLAHINWPNTLTSIGSQAFTVCTSLTSVVIPDSVTSIGVYAFSNCSLLESIVIGDSVTSIGDDAFYDCTSLNVREIPEGVTYIGECAFYVGNGSQSPMYGGEITLPSTLKTLHCSAFAYDTGPVGGDTSFYLSRITLLSPTPPTLYTELNNEVVSTADHNTIFRVPKGCEKVYKEAEGWSGYANQIVEVS